MCFYTAKIATAAHRTNPNKKTKSLRHKHRADAQGYLLFRFLLVFYLPSREDAYKNHSYAKATSYHYPSAFGSLSTQ
jgi:hypothetical protein